MTPPPPKEAFVYELEQLVREQKRVIKDLREATEKAIKTSSEKEQAKTWTMNASPEEVVEVIHYWWGNLPTHDEDSFKDFIGEVYEISDIPGWEDELRDHVREGYEHGYEEGRSDAHHTLETCGLEFDDADECASDLETSTNEKLDGDYEIIDQQVFKTALHQAQMLLSKINSELYNAAKAIEETQVDYSNMP